MPLSIPSQTNTVGIQDTNRKGILHASRKTLLFTYLAIATLMMLPHKIKSACEIKNCVICQQGSETLCSRCKYGFERVSSKASNGIVMDTCNKVGHFWSTFGKWALAALVALLVGGVVYLLARELRKKKKTWCLKKVDKDKNIQSHQKGVRNGKVMSQKQKILGNKHPVKNIFHKNNKNEVHIGPHMSNSAQKSVSRVYSPTTTTRIRKGSFIANNPNQDINPNVSLNGSVLPTTARIHHPSYQNGQSNQNNVLDGSILAENQLQPLSQSIFQKSLNQKQNLNKELNQDLDGLTLVRNSHNLDNQIIRHRNNNVSFGNKQLELYTQSRLPPAENVNAVKNAQVPLFRNAVDLNMSQIRGNYSPFKGYAEMKNSKMIKSEHLTPQKKLPQNSHIYSKSPIVRPTYNAPIHTTNGPFNTGIQLISKNKNPIFGQNQIQGVSGGNYLNGRGHNHRVSFGIPQTLPYHQNQMQGEFHHPHPNMQNMQNIQGPKPYFNPMNNRMKPIIPLVDQRNEIGRSVTAAPTIYHPRNHAINNENKGGEPYEQNKENIDPNIPKLPNNQQSNSKKIPKVNNYKRQPMTQTETESSISIIEKHFPNHPNIHENGDYSAQLKKLKPKDQILPTQPMNNLHNQNFQSMSSSNNQNSEAPHQKAIPMPINLRTSRNTPTAVDNSVMPPNQVMNNGQNPQNEYNNADPYHQGSSYPPVNPVYQGNLQSGENVPPQYYSETPKLGPPYPNPNPNQNVEYPQRLISPDQFTLAPYNNQNQRQIPVPVQQPNQNFNVPQSPRGLTILPKQHPMHRTMSDLSTKNGFRPRHLRKNLDPRAGSSGKKAYSSSPEIEVWDREGQETTKKRTEKPVFRQIHCKNSALQTSKISKYAKNSQIDPCSTPLMYSNTNLMNSSQHTSYTEAQSPAQPQNQNLEKNQQKFRKIHAKNFKGRNRSIKQLKTFQFKQKNNDSLRKKNSLRIQREKIRKDQRRAQNGNNGDFIVRKVQIHPENFVQNGKMPYVDCLAQDMQNMGFTPSPLHSNEKKGRQKKQSLTCRSTTGTLRLNEEEFENFGRRNTKNREAQMQLGQLRMPTFSADSRVHHFLDDFDDDVVDEEENFEDYNLNLARKSAQKEGLSEVEDLNGVKLQYLDEEQSESWENTNFESNENRQKLSQIDEENFSNADLSQNSPRNGDFAIKMPFQSRVLEKPSLKNIDEYSQNHSRSDCSFTKSASSFQFNRFYTRNHNLQVGNDAENPENILFQQDNTENLRNFEKRARNKESGHSKGEKMLNKFLRTPNGVKKIENNRPKEVDIFDNFSSKPKKMGQSYNSKLGFDHEDHSGVDLSQNYSNSNNFKHPIPKMSEISYIQDYSMELGPVRGDLSAEVDLDSDNSLD